MQQMYFFSLIIFTVQDDQISTRRAKRIYATFPKAEFFLVENASRGDLLSGDFAVIVFSKMGQFMDQQMQCMRARRRKASRVSSKIFKKPLFQDSQPDQNLQASSRVMLQWLKRHSLIPAADPLVKAGITTLTLLLSTYSGSESSPMADKSLEAKVNEEVKRSAENSVSWRQLKEKHIEKLLLEHKKLEISPTKLILLEQNLLKCQHGVLMYLKRQPFSAPTVKLTLLYHLTRNL